MPINNNEDAMNAYDIAVGNIQVPHLVVSQPDREHASHCVAFEILRGIMAAVPDAAAYNNMSEAQYEQLCAEAKVRASLNPTSALETQGLTVDDINQCCNLGGNYFEHGYVTIIGNTSQEDRRNFNRVTGVS